MQLCINGERTQWPAGSSIAEILERLGLADRRLAVELNGAIIPKSRHATTRLEADDRLEIVHAIGGG